MYTSRWKISILDDHAQRMCLKGIAQSSALQRLVYMVDIPMKKTMYSSLTATTSYRCPLVL